MDRHPNMPARGAHSPWGGIDHVTQLGPDACSVSTPSHGGVWISPEARARIPEAFRATWYEEDCRWAIPFAFLDLHQHRADPEASRVAALDTLRHWEPDAYEAFTGQELKRGESRARDEEAFYVENAQRFIVTAAWGDHAAWVPDGWVGCLAMRGGRPPSMAAPRREERWFMVPAAEYGARTGWFVIDEARHPQTPKPENTAASKVRAA